MTPPIRLDNHVVEIGAGWAELRDGSDFVSASAGS